MMKRSYAEFVADTYDSAIDGTGSNSIPRAAKRARNQVVNTLALCFEKSRGNQCLDDEKPPPERVPEFPRNSDVHFPGEMRAIVARFVGKEEPDCFDADALQVINIEAEMGRKREEIEDKRAQLKSEQRVLEIRCADKKNAVTRKRASVTKSQATLESTVREAVKSIVHYFSETVVLGDGRKDPMRLFLSSQGATRGNLYAFGQAGDGVEDLLKAMARPPANDLLRPQRIVFSFPSRKEPFLWVSWNDLFNKTMYDLQAKRFTVRKGTDLEYGNLWAEISLPDCRAGW
jgi:hypothetical protein